MKLALFWPQPRNYISIYQIGFNLLGKTEIYGELRLSVIIPYLGENLDLNSILIKDLLREYLQLLK